MPVTTDVYQTLRSLRGLSAEDEALVMMPSSLKVEPDWAHNASGLRQGCG
jgi:hypothetical protein